MTGWSFWANRVNNSVNMGEKKKKNKGVLSPTKLGWGRDQMQNYEENVQIPILVG